MFTRELDKQTEQFHFLFKHEKEFLGLHLFMKIKLGVKE